MSKQDRSRDLIIVGGGPAGFSAGIYAARASLDALVLEQGMPGGQIATSDTIDNYPGIPSMGGAELGDAMRAHAEEAGAAVDYAMVESISRDDDGFFHVDTGSEVLTAPAVIVATGAKPRQGGFEGEETYRGRGVSYCATCDAMFYRGKRVYVIGGGNSACEEALFLSRIAREVIMVVRRDVFRAPRGIVDRLLAQDNVSVRYQTSIVKLAGETMPTEITFRDNASGDLSVETLDAGSFGIFVFTGTDPETALVADLVDLADDGGVLTDGRMATRTPGLYCAGDMRHTELRQVITAASDGAVAATFAYRFLDEGGLL